MKEAIFHPEARAEMRESIEFYEARLEGLGLRFLSAVEQMAERISTHPEAGAGRRTCHRARTFGLAGSVSGSCQYIYLVAVAHHHRRPGYWRDRSTRR